MVFSTTMAIVIGYLLGSFPSAYIASRLRKGIDIRQVGSGNMGALNVMRTVGIGIGYAVWAADIAKGALAVLVAQWLGLSLEWVLAAGFAAVVGHSWPIFLGFRGGKGGATIIGVLLVLVPIEVLISLGATAIVVIITSNPALGQTIGLAVLPLIIWQMDGRGILIAYALILGLFLSLRYVVAGLMRTAEGDSDIKKGLIFDREYHFWQTRKKYPRNKNTGIS